MSTWVLLRGLTRERGHWGAFPTQLSLALGSAVVALDLPGNGARHLECSPAQIGAMADDVDVQVGRLGIPGPVCVLAMSLGAMVAIDWAHRTPSRIERMALISTSLRSLSPLHRRMRPQAAVVLLWRLLLGAAQPLEEAVLHVTSARADTAALRHWLALRATHPVSRANALRQLLAAARFRTAAAPCAPTLLLAGQGDRLVDPRCSEQIATAWRCPLAMHPTAGHDLPLDDPDWVIAQVRGWVARPADRQR
jgi:pimeloyl-ACP methyl ester carboxylesterase